MDSIDLKGNALIKTIEYNHSKNALTLIYQGNPGVGASKSRNEVMPCIDDIINQYYPDSIATISHNEGRLVWTTTINLKTTKPKFFVDQLSEKQLITEQHNIDICRKVLPPDLHLGGKGNGQAVDLKETARPQEMSVASGYVGTVTATNQGKNSDRSGRG